MSGSLWPKDLGDRWYFRFFAALAAAIILLLVGFVVGSLWAVGGVGFTKHVLVPEADHLFSISYVGIWIKTLLIIASIVTRVGILIMVVLLVYPFFKDAKLRWYVMSAIVFAFYGWFFATMYIIYR